MLFVALLSLFLLVLFVISYFAIIFLFQDEKFEIKLVGAEKPISDITNISVNSRTLELINFDNEIDCIIQVKGLSMEAATKQLFDKDYLVCRKILNHEELKRGNNIIIKKENKFKIRELVKVIDKQTIETCHHYKDKETVYRKHKLSDILGYVTYKIDKELIKEVA